MNANNIPEKMRELDHWVLWKKDPAKGKIPYQINGKMAKSNDQSTWASFSNALKCLDRVKHDGIGFMFTGSWITGIDIDHCIDENGHISMEAQTIIDQCSSYTEKSPSGTGIHILVEGTVPSGIKSAEIEMYCEGRYFTVTGDRLNDYGVEARQDVLNRLHKKFAKAVKEITDPADPQFWKDPSPRQNDSEVLQRAFKSQQGAKIKALYDGDMSAQGNDHSRADQALCNYLAFWLDKDFHRIDQAFKNSQLYRDKWDRTDYKKMTIDKAIAGCNRSVSEPMAAAEDFKGEDFTPYIPCGQSGQPEPLSLADKPDSMLNYLESGQFQLDKDKFGVYRDRKTGFPNLDKQLKGLYPGLYCVGGISSVGKTTFTHQLVDQLAAMGDHVIYFSLEQSKLELFSKSIARITAQIDYQKRVPGIWIKCGDNSESVKQAIEVYRDAAQRMNIIEGNFETTTTQIRSYVERYIKNNEGARVVVVVDYLQILQGDKIQVGKEKIDTTITELKRIQRDYKITMLVISSLNRSNYLTPIDFESFLGSSGIEYTCDVVWGLQLDAINGEIFYKEGNIKAKREAIKNAKEAEPRMIELSSLKNRNGKSSFTCTFTYYPANDLFIPEVF